MRQVVQSYKTGEVSLRNVAVPLCSSKRVLVKNNFSLISIGTEVLLLNWERNPFA